jgi:hypothetical protein
MTPQTQLLKLARANFAKRVIAMQECDDSTVGLAFAAFHRAGCDLITSAIKRAEALYALGDYEGVCEALREVAR